MNKKNLLVVDDEEIILSVLAEDLNRDDLFVQTASNGEEAMNLLAKNHYNLIVTDLAMPGVDGIEVLRVAKQLDPTVCVVILTGYGNMTSAIEALRLGADDYLLKPCESEELYYRISRCLNRQELQRKIKLYEDIVPVCAGCKSIRDDASADSGQGEWFRLEEYINKKTGLQLSHGYCPDCYQKALKDMTDQGTS